MLPPRSGFSLVLATIVSNLETLLLTAKSDKEAEGADDIQMETSDEANDETGAEGIERPAAVSVRPPSAAVARMRKEVLSAHQTSLLAQDSDWRCYRCLASLKKNFDIAFKETWA